MSQHHQKLSDVEAQKNYMLGRRGKGTSPFTFKRS